MDQITLEEFKQKIDNFMDGEWFPHFAVTRDGEPRVVLMHIEVFRSIRRTSAVREATEEELKAIMESKMPDGFEHLDEELKADKE
jgi:PHD/YefM family antitoxin component YafN of YafNO toxin-antitoxin module